MQRTKANNLSLKDQRETPDYIFKCKKIKLFSDGVVLPKPNHQMSPEKHTEAQTAGPLQTVTSYRNVCRVVPAIILLTLNLDFQINLNNIASCKSEPAINITYQSQNTVYNLISCSVPKHCYQTGASCRTLISTECPTRLTLSLKESFNP